MHASIPGKKEGSWGLQIHSCRCGFSWSFLNGNVFTIMAVNYLQDSLVLGFLPKGFRDIKCAPFPYHERQDTRGQINRRHIAWLKPPGDISVAIVNKFGFRIPTVFPELWSLQGNKCLRCNYMFSSQRHFQAFSEPWVSRKFDVYFFFIYLKRG